MLMLTMASHHAGLQPAGFFNDYHLRLFSECVVPATACLMLKDDNPEIAAGTHTAQERDMSSTCTLHM
jgi:hypothetical protein